MDLFKLSSEVTVSLSLVAEIATEAGEAIMKVYNETPAEEWKKIADFKADGSPLTVADKNANAIICDRLRKAYPSIPIMSEENEEDAYEVRRTWPFFWCVDPLDGTKEFIKRNGQFTVNIGLVRGTAPVAGVVYIPATCVMYTAAEGLGAFRDGARVRAAAFSESDHGLKIVASLSHATSATQAFIDKYDAPELTSKGSSLKLLMIAEGAAHVYPRMAPCMEWDTCAAHAIVNCAGGEVLQHTGYRPCDHGQPLVYNKEDTHNPWFVVYGVRRRRSRVHYVLLASLAVAVLAAVLVSSSRSASSS